MRAQTVRAQQGDRRTIIDKIVANNKALTINADQTVRAQTVRAQLGDRKTIVDQRMS